MKERLIALHSILTSENDFSFDPIDKEGIESAKKMAKLQFDSVSSLLPLADIFENFIKSEDRSITRFMQSASPVLCLMIFRLNHYGTPLKVKNKSYERKKILAGVGFGVALTLSVATAVALSVVSLGILAPVGTGLVAGEIALICGAFTAGIGALGSIGSGIFLVNMFYDQIRANYKKKLRIIFYGNEASHCCEPEDVLEQKNCR